MNRGELYRVRLSPGVDPRRSRVFVVVSRQGVVESRFSTVICAPIYTISDGMTTQVPVGIDEGLKHHSSIHCDELTSLPKSRLTDYIGRLSPAKTLLLNNALSRALGLPEASLAESLMGLL